MESTEFDAALGGTEILPFSANSLKLAASRSVEIAAMTESILRPSKTKLIFQSLPVHMRRRVMSHNSRRLPVKLREGHMEQLKKSGLPPKQKRPSRKYRRRPKNLLDEYNRRKKKNVWLETHIWHAKRFHMIERWGHRLAYAPCDKAFRACYRASSAHCLLQDMSYYIPFKISGPLEYIRQMFESISSRTCGLGLCAKAYTNGNREGTIQLYKPNTYPYGYIGKALFIWESSTNDKKVVWLFVHPSQKEIVKMVLADLCSESSVTEDIIPQKKRKLDNNLSDEIKINHMPQVFNRFRLTGPKSHSVLTHCLKCVENYEKISHSDWVSFLADKKDLFLKEKHVYWDSLKSANCSTQLPPSMVLGLIVKDPRLSRPKHRTKAQPSCTISVDVDTLAKIPLRASSSPLWNTNIHDSVKNKRLTNAQFIEHVTKTRLVPSEVYEDDPALQSVPIVLIQRPGSQDPNFKKLGYGGGWDIIVPSGYGVFFWQTFIMFGARSGGLRETENMAFEKGDCYLPPDSEAGTAEEKKIEYEQKEKYFRLPPSKRVNYVKLAINSPFICPWQILLKDWCNTTVDKFFVLRDKNILQNLQQCVLNKRNIPVLQSSSDCIVAIHIQIPNKGSLKRNALICLPETGDLTSKSLLEPHHEDPNENNRKLKRKEHLKNVKKWRRHRVKLIKKGQMMNGSPQKLKDHEISEYVKSMRELWLPSNINSVRYSSSRQVMGYLSQAAFCFTEAQSCGIGYIAYNALSTLLNNGLNKVLVRNTTSRSYRLANIKIITNM